jgi:hypothetical protein
LSFCEICGYFLPKVTQDAKALIPRDEFFASLDRGEEEYRQGKTHRINSVEELHSFLNSL